MTTRLIGTLIILTTIVVLATPACGVIYDPKSDTATTTTINQPTPQEVNQQMKGDKVKPQTGPLEETAPTEGPELPSGDPQAILAVTNGSRQNTSQATALKAKQSGSNVQLGLAITCGLLGLFAVAGMLAVRYGPKTREPIALSYYQDDFEEEEEMVI